MCARSLSGTIAEYSVLNTKQTIRDTGKVQLLKARCLRNHNTVTLILLRFQDTMDK